MSGLDINWFREDKGYKPDVIRDSLKKRYRDPKLVDEIIEKDQEWRKIRYQLDMLKKEWNGIGKLIRDKKKANKEDPCAEEIAAKNANEDKQKQVQEIEKQQLAAINKLINSVGNIVHESVPISDNEDNNKVERVWGELPPIKPTGKKGGLHHHEILKLIGGYDPERGQKVAGHRGYFLRGPGVLLNNALINYGLKFLSQHQYDLVQPPFFLKKDIMMETCQLSDFEENLYKVQGKGEDDDNDYFLIATSEQPISAMHRGQWMDDKTLPIKYGGQSVCFRKQAGAHGKDTWGIFRVHQFEKVEQFIVSKPEESWEQLEKMIRTAEEFYQSLEIPYRVINIVSGALNDAAAKKYDLEAWFPGFEGYRELVSCSNCTDFQARNLGVRCGMKTKDEKQKKYVHMLNGTLCATERTICCILENYQTEEGVRVPKVLQPYVGTDFIPYIQKKEEKEDKKKKDDKKNDKKKDDKDKKAKQKVEETQENQKKENQKVEEVKKEESKPSESEEKNQ